MKKIRKECRKTLDHICENLGEDLSSQRCASIRRHLDGCADCAAYLKSLRRIIALYKSYPIPSLSRNGRKRLEKALNSASI